MNYTLGGLSLICGIVALAISFLFYFLLIKEVNFSLLFNDEKGVKIAKFILFFLLFCFLFLSLLGVMLFFSVIG